MINERVPTDRNITVECGLSPLPLGARMRANMEILLGWVRRTVRVKS